MANVIFKLNFNLQHDDEPDAEAIKHFKRLKEIIDQQGVEGFIDDDTLRDSDAWVYTTTMRHIHDLDWPSMFLIGLELEEGDPI